METPTGSSDLSIFDHYRLVNHNANFTKCFFDEVARKTEGSEALFAKQQQESEERRI